MQTSALKSETKGVRDGVLAVAAHTDVVVPEVASTLRFVRFALRLMYQLHADIGPALFVF
jgi:hypothetical protein